MLSYSHISVCHFSASNIEGGAKTNGVKVLYEGRGSKIEFGLQSGPYKGQFSVLLITNT